MGTRVEIDFRGLCMFVPGTDANGNAVVHVLLPATHAGSMPGMDKHTPRIVYSVDYDGSPGGSSSAVDPRSQTVNDSMHAIELTGNPVIDWSSCGPSATSVSIPRDIIDVIELLADAGIHGAQVHDQFVGPQLPAGGPCAARVTLPGGVSITPYNVRELPVSNVTGCRRLAPCAICVFEMDGLSLPLPATVAPGGLTNSGGVIRVMIGNLLDGDYDHPPTSIKSTGSHFPAFFELLRSDPATKPIPATDPTGCTGPEVIFSPTVITCMLAAGRT